MFADLPPCELVATPPQWQQTYVVLGGLETSAACKTIAMAKAVSGAGVWAIHQRYDEAYLVITLGKGGCEQNKKIINATSIARCKRLWKKHKQ